MEKALLIIFLGLMTSACSKKSDDGSTASGATAAEIQIASTQSAADEATDAIAESGSSSGYLLSVATEQEYSPQAVTVSKTCTTSGNNASVAMSFSGSENLSFQKSIVTVSVDIVKAGTETRLWSPASGSLGCTNGTHAAINWTSLSTGLTLSVTLDRSINRSKTIQIARASGTVTRTASDNVIVNGQRTVTFAAPVTSGANKSITKTIVSSVTRQKTFTRTNGVAATTTSTVAVESGSPLNVTVLRNGTTGALVTKTINSGTVKVTETDGTLNSCEFLNVVYDFANSNTTKCLPTSGTITCSRYASASDSTVQSTVELKFGQATSSSVSISVDGATAEDYSDYNTRGCDLESAT